VSFHIQEIPEESVSKQLKHLEDFRRNRSKAVYEKAISSLEERASEKDSKRRRNLLPFIVDAVKANATTGEISNALRSSYGEFHAKF